MSLPDVQTSRCTWPQLVRVMDWRQGEHVTLVGPTGRGKTELIVKLLQARHWAIFFGTKKRDDTQDRLRRVGWETVPDPHEINAQIHHHYILRPPFPRKATADQLKRTHREIFRQGIMEAFNQTGWAVVVDEGRYICDFLGLRDEMTLLWLQGRSQGNTVVCATQRSRFIPLEAYDQATHLFLWADNDAANLRRNTELTGFNQKEAASAMAKMGKHDVLYVNTTSGEMFITNTRWE